MKTKYSFYSLILFFCICSNAQNLENATSGLTANFIVASSEVESSYLDSNDKLGVPSNHILEVIYKEYDPIKQKNNSKATSSRSNHFMIGALLGLPIGDEADFYGFTYSIFTAYLFVVSQKLSIGPSVWYTQFTGKDTGFGFSTEGLGYIPLKLMAVYYITSLFAISAALGYALATTQGVDNGLAFNIGPVWNPVKSFALALQFQSIKFGTGNIGAITLGARKSF